MPDENQHPQRPPQYREEATQFAQGGDDLQGFEEDDFDFLEAEPSANASVGLLGEYLLIEPIGSGGMGKVYRAEHRTMNRQVALKVLGDSIASHEQALAQFYSEVRAVAQLMHPNIVTAFDAGNCDDKHYLVMELVDGEVLSQQVREHGSLSSSEAVNVLEQAAEALVYAHSMGIVHRDIKPSNMMLARDGKLKILDFGLAHISKAPRTNTQNNMFMGTPEYMSPEQIEDPESVDGRSDLYSLGATLFYLLTSRAMFSGQRMQVATAQLRQKAPALFTVRPDIDLRLDAVFQKLVAKKPDDRYDSAEALLEDLHEMNLASRPAVLGAFRRGANRLISDNPTSVAMSRSTLAKKSQIVAIDLGMLVSTAAYFDSEVGPQVIQQGEGNAQHLRNMLSSADGQLSVGQSATSKRQTAPASMFHSVQRWIGAPEVNWQIDGKKLPPEVALAAIIKQVMRNAESITEGGRSAIVTVPSCYDQLHRRAIRTACEVADIELVQLLDKPLAAAMCWLDLNARLATNTPTNSPNRILVVHLGGSCMEASVVSAEGRVARQLGTHGNWKLGSQRWQFLLGEFFAGVLKEKTGRSIREDVAAATRLQRTIELGLDRLTRTTKIEIQFSWEGETINQVVTQEGLVRIAPGELQQIQNSINAACKMAKTDLADVSQVLLVGSLMRIRPIQNIVKKLLPAGTPVELLEKADLARGAAIQAHYLTRLSSTGDTLRSVGCTAYDLAIVTATDKGLKPKVLIPAGTNLPAVFSNTLRPGADADGSFPPVQIIEGTSQGEANWLKLGRVRPSNLFPQRQPDDPLQLQLECDDSGLLRSSLIWTAGNRQALLPETSDATMLASDVQRWRTWLHTVFNKK